MGIFSAKPCIQAAAATILASIFLSPSAWSWGPVGHRVAARMAEERLTPAALTAVHDLLGPGVSLADVSTWADEQQEVKGTGSWHYVNVPITESRYDSKYCPRGGCVVNKIEDCRRALLNPKAGRVEKQRALKFLIHFIADLHQPLHVGDTGSRAGNDIQVRFFGAGSNLHRVWDSEIMERHTKNEQVWLWDLTYYAKPEKVKEWVKGTVEDWATESLQIAREAYCLPGSTTVMKSGTKLGNEYYGFALPIIQRQLAKAGVRIAWMLNEIFR
jgi:hypothetical protein